MQDAPYQLCRKNQDPGETMIREVMGETAENGTGYDRLGRLNKLLRASTSINQLIIRNSGSSSMLEEACKILVNHTGYRMAWVGTLKDEGKILHPVSWSDHEVNQLQDIAISPDEKCSIGMAIQTGKASISSDLTNAPPSFLSHCHVTIGDYGSIGSFPIHRDRNVVGIINVLTRPSDTFLDEEIEILSELADNIGFVLSPSIADLQKATPAFLDNSDFWLNESQRVARIGFYVYEISSGYWSSSSVLDEILGINETYRRDFRSWLHLIYPEDRAQLVSGIKMCMSDRKTFEAEFRIVRPTENEVRWIWGRVEVLEDSSGRPIKLFGTVQDISGRKAAEEALAQSEKLFHTSFEDSSIGIALIGLDGKYQKVNAKFIEMLGYSGEELLNLGCRDLTFRDDVMVADKILADAFAGKTKRGKVEKRYVRKDGSIIWVEFSVSLVSDQEGNPDYLIANFSDITEHKRAEYVQ
jgi:PAS domain S-box-containing protein